MGEVIQNRYLSQQPPGVCGLLRSYARQGLDIVPTVHEGLSGRWKSEYPDEYRKPEPGN